jgi:hypothetical protein
MQQLGIEPRIQAKCTLRIFHYTTVAYIYSQLFTPSKFLAKATSLRWNSLDPIKNALIRVAEVAGHHRRMHVFMGIQKKKIIMVASLADATAGSRTQDFAGMSNFVDV